MKKLLQIRNDIEHNDAIPPNQLRCKDLVDVICYFPKSIDMFAEGVALNQYCEKKISLIVVLVLNLTIAIMNKQN